MSEFTTYSPDEVILTWNDMIINGYANDTFIEVERDEDGFMKYTGSLGDVARSRNLNRGGKVTITLMAAATINDSLYSLAALDEFDGTGFGTLQIKELNGTTRCHAEIAWLQKWPKIERGKESGTIQWVLDCADIEIVPGGRTQP